MQFSLRMLRAAALAAVLGTGLVACGSDIAAPPATPPAPTGLTATGQSETSVLVGWNAVTGATSYTLERADASAPGIFTALGGSITATSYTDNSVASGVAYSYRVAAVNANGTGSFSSTASVTVAGAKVKTLSGNYTTDLTLHADTLYTLSGYVKIGNGKTITIDQTALLDQATTKVYALLVSCSDKCFEENRGEINKVVESWTVRDK